MPDVALSWRGGGDKGCLASIEGHDLQGCGGRSPPGRREGRGDRGSVEGEDGRLITRVGPMREIPQWEIPNCRGCRNDRSGHGNNPEEHLPCDGLWP